MSMSVTSATVEQLQEAIDTALQHRGGIYATYACRKVSWDDVSRGTLSGDLSCWGANITDTYLKGRDGQSLFTVRSENWNEKLGLVSASHVKLIVGNCDNNATHLRTITLLDLLRSPCETAGKYVGLEEDISLIKEKATDELVSIRFQTVFLPVAAVDSSSTRKPTLKRQRETFEFATEAYNYNTKTDSDPRNLILLATTQGTALQADGVGAKRLLHHGLDSNGVPMQYWLEAERSDHAVGGEQNETSDERSDAIARGKATSETIGIPAMGSRFNTLMTIQIPLQQEPQIAVFSTTFSANLGGKGRGKRRKSGRSRITHGLSIGGSAPRVQLATKAARKSSPKTGTANAARVSRGSEYAIVAKLAQRKPRRNATELVTVTVVFYNTVIGGIPSKDDVIASVTDMEALYAACTKSGNLNDSCFDPMKTELKVADAAKIADKILTDPPVVTNPPNTGSVQPSVTTGVDKNEAEKVALSSLDQLDNGSCLSDTVHEVKFVVTGALITAGKSRVDIVTKQFDELATLIDVGNQAEACSKCSYLKLLVQGAFSS